MVRANFSAYGAYVTDSLHQWDINRTLQVTGLNLSVIPEIHFSNSNMKAAIVRQATLDGDMVRAEIPNSLLQQPLRIIAHIGIYEGRAFKVVETVEVPVIPRKRPEDYEVEDSDEEVYSFKRLENEIANRATRTEASALGARIDTIVANANRTEGNSELVDLRVAADGVVHESAGSAVRSVGASVEELHRKLLPKNHAFPSHELVNVGGGVQVHSTYYSTGVVPCAGYKYLNYFSRMASYCYEVVFYDANKNIMPEVSIPGMETTHTRVINLSEVGASYVNVGTIENEENGATKDKFLCQLYTRDAAGELDELGASVYPVENKNILIFGDSITETANMGADGSNYVEGAYINWPKHIPELLGTSNFKNYAKSGAHFADFPTTVHRQKLSDQIALALADTSFVPDVIVVSLGTNDGGYTPIDSYAEAMSVITLDALDRTKLYQSIRYSLWALRKNYPDALGFITTPIQRADREPIEAISDAIKKLGRRYGFIVIDAESESGIIRENEVWLSAGTFLKDGLHPREVGSRKLAELYCAAIKARFV